MGPKTTPVLWMGHTRYCAEPRGLSFHTLSFCFQRVSDMVVRELIEDVADSYSLFYNT